MELAHLRRFRAAGMQATPLRVVLRQHVRHAATHRLLALAREAMARHEMLEGRRPVSLPAGDQVAAG